MEQAVIVRLVLSDDEFGSAEERETIFAFEDQHGQEVASYEIKGMVPDDAKHEAWRRYEADHWPPDLFAERYETNVEEL